MQSFNDLSSSINIADLAESIVSNNSQALKDGLRDIMELNGMVNSQVNTSMQLWNIYLDNPMDKYLLGQVMNSLITSIRALTLRSSVDQALILSLIKQNFNDDNSSSSDFGQRMDSRESRSDNNWRSLRQE